MKFESWCAVAGVLLLGMALIPSRLKGWPLTTSTIYLGIGMLFGPLLAGKISLSPFQNGELLERLTEIAVLISLFTAGLKLRSPLSEGKWKIPLRLAFISMTITVFLIAIAGVFGLGLPIGAAILLGGILSPTDPVLASDVQVEHSGDDDRLRFSLTGEAGFNDGTAFPFVMLGLGVLGLHDLGGLGWKWFAVDVAWSIVGGIGSGALWGYLVAKRVIHLRARRSEAVGTDDFLALGLIAISYGVALWLHTYGFLAVFAAGLALRHTEREVSEKSAENHAPSDATGAESAPISETMKVPEDDAGVQDLRDKIATHPDSAASFMAREMLHFNESLERIAELGLVVILGGMLSRATWSVQALWLAPLIFLVIRPISTWAGLLGAPKMSGARPYISWFGIRGIGSLYYLFYATQHGLSQELARTLTALVFSVVALSIVAHGISVTPLMKIYNRQTQKREELKT
ncbi:cation:proton antiporter [Abditibacterium utsteinense]|uniref:cation:proton antiporter n=1 Tax=Abditibacterium utsteinense TaxID=1960156 RepID=UPI001931049D|nr:sodium:proton antiporter [Abditibacterium utsteinense]